MTIVLVILAVLILLAVLFLIHRVNKVGDSILSATMDRYAGIYNHITCLKNDVTKQVSTVITAVNDERTDVVRLANKVDEGLIHCGNQTQDLKEKIDNLDSRLTAPIDKINDTHNRIKTLGKGATSTNELRDIVGNVVGDIAREAVNDAVDRLSKKSKTTKKVTKEPIKEGKL